MAEADSLKVEAESRTRVLGKLFFYPGRIPSTIKDSINSHLIFFNAVIYGKRKPLG